MATSDAISLLASCHMKWMRMPGRCEYQYYNYVPRYHEYVSTPLNYINILYTELELHSALYLYTLR